jgi:hypothetical protein
MTSAENVVTTLAVTEAMLAITSLEQVAAATVSIEQPTPVLTIVES